MLKKLLFTLCLVSVSACSNEVNTIQTEILQETVQSQSVKNSVTNGDISSDVVNKIAKALDVNKDNVIDSKEVYVSINDSKGGYIANYDFLNNKPLAPIAINAISSTLLAGNNISISFTKDKAVNESLLTNLSHAFDTDSINTKKVKVYSTNIPYMAIFKTKTLVVSLNPEQLAKKINDGLSSVGFIEIMGKYKLIAGKDKSRIRFSIYDTLDKKLPLFSSDTYSDAKIE